MRASNYANIDRTQKEGTADKEKNSAHSHRVQQLNESLRPQWPFGKICDREKIKKQCSSVCKFSCAICK